PGHLDRRCAGAAARSGCGSRGRSSGRRSHEPGRGADSRPGRQCERSTPMSMSNRARRMALHHLRHRAYAHLNLIPLIDLLSMLVGKEMSERDIAQREITILADKSLPYEVLKRVMATCTDADYGRISLAVIQKEKPVAAEQLKPV